MSPKEFSRALRELTRVPSRIARPVSFRIAAEIQKQFDEGIDPYGNRWASLAPATLAKGRRPPPLTDTRAGRNSIEVLPAPGAGIKILVGVRYMRLHQIGILGRLPRRSFLPVGVLPKKWNDIWKEEQEKEIRKRLHV